MTKKISFVLMAMAAFAIIVPALASAAILNRQLEVGDSGADVGSLQTFLAQDPTLYPQGLVTSYFGFLTKSAVANFQSRNDLPAVGRVGPMTLPVLNAQMAGGVTVAPAAYAPAITGVGLNTTSNSANVSWNTNEAARGLVYYSSTPLIAYENGNSVNVTGSTAFTDSTFRYSQNVAITGLQSNTVYYYLVYTTDQDGNVSVTWPAAFRTN